MAEYRVLQTFRDKETKEVYKEGHDIELTVKRADEAIKNLSKYEGEFLERLDNKQQEDDSDEGKTKEDDSEGHETEAKQKEKGQKAK